MFSPCALIRHCFREINYSLKNYDSSFCRWLSAYLFYRPASLSKPALTLYIKPTSFSVMDGGCGTLWNRHLYHLAKRPASVCGRWLRSSAIRTPESSWERRDPRGLWDRPRGGRAAKPPADDSFFFFFFVLHHLLSHRAITHILLHTHTHQNLSIQTCAWMQKRVHAERWRQM